MKESKAIIGLSINDGRKITKRRFEKALSSLVEGATVQYARGLWKGKWEACAIVTIAGSVRAIRQQMVKLGRMLEQEAVYFQGPNGVQIIPC